MNIEIRKLTPDLAQDYAHFFDTTPHNHSGDGNKCYCITFCKDNVYNTGGSHWYRTPDERRCHGVKRVQDGDIQGYLAYLDGEAVGWCNAGTKTDYTAVVNYIRSEGIPVDECNTNEMIKFIFCFTVAPKVQRKGIATQLLKRICQDAADEGFDFVETHTHKDFLRDGFRGTLKMFEKCNFNVYAENENNIVVRKTLK